MATSPSTSSISYIQLARGPIIVLGVLISLIYPYVCEYCSSNLIIHLLLGIFGLLWFLKDLYNAFKQSLRAKLSLMVDNFVLDDFMRTIFDPETGLIALTVGTFVGASTMYGLNMTQDQRLRLIKSTLCLKDENITRTILLEPGGCKALLPNEIQNWLSTKDDNDHHLVERRNIEIKTDSGSSNSSDHDGGGDRNMVFGDQSIDMTSSECDEADIDVVFDEETINNAARKYSNANRDVYYDSDHHESETNGQQQQQQQQSETPLHEDIDPLAVFSKIVREMAVQQIKPYAENFPAGTVENVGVAAATVLVAQLILRQGSRAM